MTKAKEFMDSVETNRLTEGWVDDDVSDKELIDAFTKYVPKLTMDQKVDIMSWMAGMHRELYLTHEY